MQRRVHTYIIQQSTCATGSLRSLHELRVESPSHYSNKLSLSFHCIKKLIVCDFLFGPTHCETHGILPTAYAGPSTYPTLDEESCCTWPALVSRGSCSSPPSPSPSPSLCSLWMMQPHDHPSPSSLSGDCHDHLLLRSCAACCGKIPVAEG